MAILFSVRWYLILVLTCISWIISDAEHVSWPSVCFLCRNVCLGLLPIFLIELLGFLIRSCMSCLCILEFNLLSVASFANTFFHSEGCPFISFMDSFAMQKLLHIIRSHLLIFVFIFITLGGVSKKILLRFMSKSVLPMFSSKSFILLGLTVRSFIVV